MTPPALARTLCLSLCLALPPGLAAQDLTAAGHVLNRLAYGPSPHDLDWIGQVGLPAYLRAQLDPASIDEAGNLSLRQREAALFETIEALRDQLLIASGVVWHYRKGQRPAQAGWQDLGFDDSNWLTGPTGIGFGDGDDATVLTDMRRTADQDGYATLYLRRVFELDAATLERADRLVLDIDYDDGFVAYLNGTEVARRNLPPGPLSHTTLALGNHEAGIPETVDLDTYRDRLHPGDNVLALEVHNQSLTNGDLSIIPALRLQERLGGEPLTVIRGLAELQRLVHIRGVYARRQLLAVLGEFWENHFTTDYDKLVDYLDECQNADGSDAMPRAQARAEAAQLEYREYQFFHDHGLGSFGDLLLYSATSPSMLVYLDNVLNVRGAPNENYAREILELFAFGVDNRYTQADIEELARCFTGWTLTKLAPDQVQPFPRSALAPPTQSGLRLAEDVLIDLGATWRYRPGLDEPTPAPDGSPTTAWTEGDYDGDGWLAGPTGIGYGDGDDATVLVNMRNRYTSVYLRRDFTVRDPDQLTGLALEVAYDDGFVAYLNGTEVARSDSMAKRGTPPAFNRTAAGHEVTEGTERFALGAHRDLLRPGRNVLAIQVHNASLGSSDLSILPRLVDRRSLPGSVDRGDRYAIWTFRFDPERHDTGAKTLFAGTAQRIDIPAGRTGLAGLVDAVQVIQAMADHPSTVEFVCIKLIQRFVSDRITLAQVKDGRVEPELQACLDRATAAWHRSDPPGRIDEVLRAILQPETQTGAFWSETADRAKVKTPIEVINAALRGLDADTDGSDLPAWNAAMGMSLFTRDDPDGYPERGGDWMDTAGMLARIEFVRSLAENRLKTTRWHSDSLLSGSRTTADRVVDLLDAQLFQNTLSEVDRGHVLEFLLTDERGVPQSFGAGNAADRRARVEACVGYLLSLPPWQFQ